MDFQLLVVRGRSASEALKLEDGVTTVGRHDDCQIRIKSSQVSRRHCELFEKKGLLLVKDLSSANGTLVNGKMFLDVTKEPGDGAPDGMKVDSAGNLYATGPGGVWVISPQGKHLGTIAPPETPANCGWGGADGKTLYMTARTGLYRIKVNVSGMRP